DAEHRIRKGLDDGSHDFNGILFRISRVVLFLVVFVLRHKLLEKTTGLTTPTTKTIEQEPSTLTNCLPGRARYFLGPRQNQRTICGNRDGVLEMRRRAAVGGFCHPLVPHANLVASRIHHRLDRDHHTFLQSRAAPRFTVVRQVRLVMHLGADAVSHELTYYRKTVLLDQALHRVANIPEAVTSAHLVNGAVERVASYIQQLLQLRPDFSDRNRHSRIREVPIHFHPEVDGDDVAFLQLPLRRRNPVNDLTVHRRAEHAWIPAIPFKGRMPRLAG